MWWKTGFEVSAGSLIIGALAILIVPLRLLLAIFIAAVVHELFHILTLRICGAWIYSVSVSSRGMELLTEPLDPVRELICAAAGPAGSFSLLLFRGIWPELALAGLAQGLFNLIPLYPSDGGRVVGAILDLMRCSCKSTVMNFIGFVTTFIISCLCLSALVWFRRWRFVIMIGFSVFAIRRFRNISCKASAFAVQ